jgi:hydrogenase maturation protease
MSVARIIGLGQLLGGDDCVGIAVVRDLRKRGVIGAVELCEVSSPTDLIFLLAHDRPVVVVDALLDAPAGRVRQLGIESIDGASACALSSHGLGLHEAFRLARALTPDRCTPRLHLVGVTISQPMQAKRELSFEVSLAIPCASTLALSLALS